ncbi:MAG: outer membrane beta-barrel protein [Spirochaetes bacterium]|nr:outer membrane beta-barrel protein [Spirochaetota bacterium]
MKKYSVQLTIALKMFIVVSVLLMLLPDKAFARKIDYFAKPQAGIWFGVLTPVSTTRDDVGSSLGGGGFFRYTTPWTDLKLGLESSYQFYESKEKDGVNTLTLWPIYGNFLYRIPFTGRLPLTFQLKAGAGGTWVKIRPDRVNQWDPLGMIGIEGSFAAGRSINIGLRLDYLLVYEEHIEGARKNGHVINVGINLFFNI